MDKPSYRNRRGDLVTVEISRHARARFLERWRRIFPEQPVSGHVDELLGEWFGRARRIEPESRRYRNRLRRHGKDTLFFGATPFVFVVQDAAIVTVELGTEGTRHLNHGPAPATAPTSPSETPGSPPSAALPVDEPPLFMVKGCVRDRQGCLRFANLGRYPSARCGGDAQLLARDPAFGAEILRRFDALKSDLQLVGVYAGLGRRGTVSCVLDEYALDELRARLAAALRR